MFPSHLIAHYWILRGCGARVKVFVNLIDPCYLLVLTLTGRVLQALLADVINFNSERDKVEDKLNRYWNLFGT